MSFLLCFLYKLFGQTNFTKGTFWWDSYLQIFCTSKYSWARLSDSDSWNQNISGMPNPIRMKLCQKVHIFVRIKYYNMLQINPNTFCTLIATFWFAPPPAIDQSCSDHVIHFLIPNLHTIISSFYKKYFLPKLIFTKFFALANFVLAISPISVICQKMC